VLTDCVHDRKARQQALKVQRVQSEMAPDRCPASAVLRPVHAGGHHLDRRRVRRVDSTPEPPD
jgi:hypothetical protein